jgi:general stress protein CsbA
MWNYLQRLDQLAFRYIDRMTTSHWIAVIIVVVLVGTVCLQGYGSRRRI